MKGLVKKRFGIIWAIGIDINPSQTTIINEGVGSLRGIYALKE